MSFTVRVSLLAEHSGCPDDVEEAFGPIEGLVARLDARASRSRLRVHGPPSPSQRARLDVVDPQSLPFDPEGPEADALARDEPAEEPWHRGPVAVLGRLLGSGRHRRWRR